MKDIQVQTNTNCNARKKPVQTGLDDMHIIKTMAQIVKIGVYRSFPLKQEMYCNDHFREDFNLHASTPEGIYNEFLENLHSEDRERFNQYILKIKSLENLNFYPGQEVQNVLLRVRIKEDNYRYVHLFTNVEEWNPGERKIIFSGISKNSTLPPSPELDANRISIRGDEQSLFYQSITDRKNIQRELSYNQALLNMALNYAQVKAFIFHFPTKDDTESIMYIYGEDTKEPLKLIPVPWIQRLNTLHPTDRVRQQHIYEQLLGKEIEEFKTEARMLINGEMRWIEITGHVHEKDKEGNPVLLVGCYTDIQERKKYEEDLIRAREKAEMADNMKSTYLANMSHEIRTPLNAIVGFSELLSFADDPEEKQSYIDIIKANNEQLLHLIGDILDLSKIEAGLLSVTYEEIELNELMQEIYQSIRLKIAAEIDFTLEKGEGSFLFVTDRSRLNQVITNLLNNAIKHTEKGCISFGYRQEGENNLYFYVSDTGTGMPAEKLEQIFTRHVMLTPKKNGFGLGLAISKGIVEKFGGTIHVVSEEGKGSTFSFIIPIRTSLE